MVDPLTFAGIGWGMSAASWLISPVLGRLLNKCFDALGLDPRFQSQKKALDDKLEHLHTFLLPQLLILTDAAQKCPHRKTLEAWLQKLKSAYYEAEYLLDLVECKRHEKEVNSSFPSNSEFNFNWNYIELKIRKDSLLKSLENLEKIVNKAMKFTNLLNLSANSVNNSIPRPSEQYGETISTSGFTVIGRDKDRDHIIGQLREDFPESSSTAKCYSVIGIWGMAGSGKTTLAQFVCEYEKKAKYFDLVIWVHVSQKFNLHSIFRRILESALKDDCPHCESIEKLHSLIQNELKAKRYLLVLDDVWCDKDVSALDLEKLFAPMQTGKRGSKILVTTRIEGVAKLLGATNPIQLRQLDHEEFMALFMSHALRDMQNSEKHLEGGLKILGERIVEKLHRSPLAATTVAAQLRKRKDPDFWSSMLNQNLLNETMGALFLSYQHLPPQLQRCFAFFSLFPKGHRFDHDYLVSLWIAEGFVETEDNNEPVREIGHGYILELISSTFLEINSSFLEISESSDAIYCLHDLLHDLAANISKGECFRIDGVEKREIPTQTRHLYVKGDIFEEHVRKISKLRDLRTIVITMSRSLYGSYSLKEKD